MKRRRIAEGLLDVLDRNVHVLAPPSPTTGAIHIVFNARVHLVFPSVAALRGNFTGKPPLEQRFDGERNEG